MIGVSFDLNEVTLGGLLDSFRMGAGHQENQAMIRSLELSAPPPHLLGRRGDMEMELIMPT